MLGLKSIHVDKMGPWYVAGPDEKLYNGTSIDTSLSDLLVREIGDFKTKSIKGSKDYGKDRCTESSQAH